MPGNRTTKEQREAKERYEREKRGLEREVLKAGNDHFLEKAAGGRRFLLTLGLKENLLERVNAVLQEGEADIEDLLALGLTAYHELKERIKAVQQKLPMTKMVPYQAVPPTLLVRLEELKEVNPQETLGELIDRLAQRVREGGEDKGGDREE